jgi:hypothetical protein
MRLTHSLLALTVGSALAVVPAFATSVTGTANFGGTATVNTGGIFFSAGNPPVANTISPESPNTGSFTGLSGGTIQDLTGPPVTGAHPVTDFMTFTTAAGTVHFDLQTIEPGVGSAAACTSDAPGSQCTPPMSPFTLTQTSADSVSISLVLQGIAYTGTSATGSSMAEPIFTTQVVPGTITGILAQVGTDGGITESYSATLSTTTAPTTVPEPASLLLMGFGLLGAALIGRRKVRN